MRLWYTDDDGDKIIVDGLEDLKTALEWVKSMSINEGSVQTTNKSLKLNIEVTKESSQLVEIPKKESEVDQKVSFEMICKAVKEVLSEKTMQDLNRIFLEKHRLNLSTDSNLTAIFQEYQDSVFALFKHYMAK